MSCVVAHETPATARVTPPLDNCQVRIQRLPLWGPTIVGPEHILWVPSLWVPKTYESYKTTGQAH